VIDLAKLAAVLALIVLLLRLRWNLGLVLVLAAAATALLFGTQDLAFLAVESLQAVIDPLTLRLVAIVLLITFLGEILRATLQLEGLVRSLGDLFADRRWLLALMPMLIGMLPMVGGAMFSAPMVDEASHEIEVSHERRTFLNYWFRHTWEPVFPLYPSLVLAAGLMGVSVQALTVSQWPLFVAALAGGALFGLAGIGPARSPHDGQSGLHDGTPPNRRETLRLLLHSIWPILLVLVLSVALHVDLIASLLITIALLIVTQRLGPAKLWVLARGMPFGTVPIIVGAMIFRRMLEAAGAIEAVSGSLAALGIPLVVVVFAVPMVAGLLTGLLAAAFAIGLPIVLPLLGVDPIASGYGLVAYAGGFAGLMLSPLHLCLALTRVYFKAEWGGVYRRLVPAVLLLVIAAAITFWLGQ
jgi:integral membrane protein (TIGR00529 family)